MLITKWVQLSKDVHNLTANVKADGAAYSCTSESKAGVKVSEAELMLQTCKSIAPKK